MPDAEALARMYGPAYAEAGEANGVIEDPKAPEAVLQRLESRNAGTFVDFGCGSGSLLRSVRGMGWDAIGVEFDEEVARRASAEAGCRVVTGLDALRGSRPVPADAIHLGDVVEHLTAPLDVVRALAELLRPGGWLIAQGPLEAGPNVFSAVLRASRRVRSARPLEMPPYHVLQATVAGQRALFERAGMVTIEYRVSEVSWPAPARLSARVFRRPRSLLSYLLRRASQAVSALAPTRWGNRYFYLGTPRPIQG